MGKKSDPFVRPKSEDMPEADFNKILQELKPPRPSSEPPNVQRLRRDVKKMQAATYRAKDNKR